MSLGYQHGQILVRSLFQVADCQFLIAPSQGREKSPGGRLSRYSPKGTNPIQEDFTPRTLSNPKHLPKAPPPNAITLRQ